MQNIEALTVDQNVTSYSNMHLHYTAQPVENQQVKTASNIAVTQQPCLTEYHYIDDISSTSGNTAASSHHQIRHSASVNNHTVVDSMSRSTVATSRPKKRSITCIVNSNSKTISLKRSLSDFVVTKIQNWTPKLDPITLHWLPLEVTLVHPFNILYLNSLIVPHSTTTNIYSTSYNLVFPSQVLAEASSPHVVANKEN